MFYKLVTMTKWVALLMGTVAPCTLFAAMSYTFSNNSRELYEVIVPEGDKQIDEKPGIYKVDGKTGKLIPLVIGRATGVNRSYKGVLSYVGLNNNQGPHDILTVIDGKLMLINHNTNSKNQGSALVFGATGRAGIPVIDMLNGSSLQIPPISQMDDVQIYEGPMYPRSAEFLKGARLYFISVKAPSVLGSGLTFAFIVPGSSPDDKVSVINGQALLVSYNFMNENELARLVAPSNSSANVHIYSPLLINNTRVSLPRDDASKTSRQWDAQLGRFLGYVSGGVADQRRNPSTLQWGIPTYDLYRRRSMFDHLPVEIVVDTNIGTVVQAFNPFSRKVSLLDLRSGNLQLSPVELGSGKLYFLSTSAFDTATFASEAIDRNPASGAFYVYGRTMVAYDQRGQVTEASDFTNTFLYFSNDQLKLAFRKANQGTLEVIPVQGLNAKPGDKLTIVALKQTQAPNRTLHTYLVSHQSVRAKSGNVYVVVIEESASVHILNVENVFTSAYMGAEEMLLRSREFDGDLLFDNVTQTHGAAAYKKDKSAEDGKSQAKAGNLPPKPVPYLRLLAGMAAIPKYDDRAEQRYLTTTASRTLVADQLFYREYDPKGARFQATGFYLKRVPKDASDHLTEQFMPGHPIFARKEKYTNEIIHVSDSMNFQFQGTHATVYAPLKVSLFPFSPHKRDKAGEERTEYKTWNLGIAFTSSGPHSGDIPNGLLFNPEIRYPFGSLAYTKILQGIKNRNDEFHILLFFREDPKIPNSQNVVVTVNGKVNKHDLSLRRVNLISLDSPVVIHRGIVPQSDYKAHLKMDAEGSYYWDTDPSLGFDSTKKKIIKMTSATETIRARGAAGLTLREADHLKESEIGSANRHFRRGGTWEVFSRESLKSRVQGVSDQIEALAKEESGEPSRKSDGDKEGKDGKEPKASKSDLAAEQMLLDSFEKYLDELVTDPTVEQDKMRVILVEPSLKAKFRLALFKRLAKKDSKFSLANNKMRFFYPDAALDDIEVADELRFISAVPADKRRFLYVEPEFLKTNQVVTRDLSEAGEAENASAFESYDDGYPTDQEKVDLKSIFKYDPADAKASFTVLLASAGYAKTVRGYKRVAAQAPTIPTLIVSTPQEWREIQSSPTNRKEFENGLFDKFDLNFDFLTASWSMWPPGTDRSPEEVKALAKSAYNVEEMKVFPTLDRTLEQAARGQMRGKQTIIIVPAELKPIIQKLVLLRWATPDGQAASPWHYLNRSLALFRLNSKDVSQASIQDNFRAISGAASSRNAVVISDLETIERMGRPINQTGRNFTLKDPIKTKHDLLDESAVTASEEETLAQAQKSAQAQEELDSDSDADAAELANSIEDLNRQIEDLNIQASELLEIRRRKGMEQLEFADRWTDIQGDLKSRSAERDRAAEALGKLEATEEIAQAQADNRHIPHALWWIASEGKAIQPKKGKDWSLKTAVERQAATILIGTEEELNRLEGDLQQEARFFDMRQHFDIVHLTPPDEETRFRLVKALFDRPEVASLGFRFELRDANGRDPQSQLIFHFFNRVEQIAYDIKMEKTTAFVKAFTALKHALAEDLSLRRSRQIDEKFIERLFTRVFPMPLNVDILDPADPLQMIRNIDVAARNLQKIGYEGSQDLKRRVLETMYSQTRPTDTSRPIPNSQIYFGKTSKGKTFLIQKLFELLELVEYNPNKSSNADADYIFINVAKVTTDQSSDPDKTHVAKVIEQIMDLLSQPKGHRAHIVFDDFHKAVSKEVRAELFQFIQGLFEARNGMITVRSRDGKRIREIPVQNLNIYMTLNPASSEKAREEYIRPGVNYSPKELQKREVLAAIAENGFKPEESVLARWADIVNIDNFPRSAKVPELGKRVRQHSRASREMVLVQPKVIDALVERFEDAHARELLAPAASALTSIPNAAVPSRLYLVSLREDRSATDENAPVDGQINLQELTAAVRKMTQIDPVRSDDARSMLRYMALLMQNFRLQIFNNLALEGHMNDVLRLNRSGMVNLLKTYFVLGVSTHVLANPELPLHEMVVRPDQLAFLDRSQTEEFYHQFSRFKRDQSYFPANFGKMNRDHLDLGSFLKGNAGQRVPARTRQEVISQFTVKVEDVLHRLMLLYLRVNVTNLQEISRFRDAEYRAWFNGLEEKNPDERVRELMNELLNLFLDFQIEFNSPDLLDLTKDVSHEATLYDEVRFFAYMIDKAVTRVPWGIVGKFTYDVVQHSADFSLGTKTAFKEYIGSHDLSPFAITTPEFMGDMLEVGKAMVQGSKIDPMQMRIDFNRTCELLLGGAGKDGSAK